jgi:hypothetical protein
MKAAGTKSALALDSHEEMTNSLIEYFRCPDLPVFTAPQNTLSSDAGFFRFGPEIVCFGRSAVGFRQEQPDGKLYDIEPETIVRDATIQLPFDLTEVSDNLRQERYVNGSRGGATKKLIRETYYSLRPFLPLNIRKHLQRIHLSGWQDLPFPKWPVDVTTDVLFEKLLRMFLKTGTMDKIPIIWFWPKGASSCAIMTHDVESEPGRAFCSTLMNMDDEYQIPASFQIVPEERYKVSPEYLQSIRDRGFEVNVQDLNHDGRLFDDYDEFVRRAEKINQYGREYNAVGFRSAILYRNQAWYKVLDFEYDMSVPNVAHLDPQRGGCCTVMPYFVGKMLELPVTTTQDHSLFNILSDFSLDLWRQQCEAIIEHHGLMNFIIHPDYILGERAQTAFKLLLKYLSKLRAEKNVWIAQPKEVNRWWRQRSQMKLVQKNNSWTIEGAGSERAQLAFAGLDGDKLVYEVCSLAKSYS